jgi:hypothetical protein
MFHLIKNYNVSIPGKNKSKVGNNFVHCKVLSVLRGITLLLNQPLNFKTQIKQLFSDSGRKKRRVIKKNSGDYTTQRDKYFFVNILTGYQAAKKPISITTVMTITKSIR